MRLPPACMQAAWIEHQSASPSCAPSTCTPPDARASAATAATPMPLPSTPTARLATALKLLAKGQRKQGPTRLHTGLMTCLENNPVLAAYGAVRSGSAQLMWAEVEADDGGDVGAASPPWGDGDSGSYGSCFSGGPQQERALSEAPAAPYDVPAASTPVAVAASGTGAAAASSATAAPQQQPGMAASEDESSSAVPPPSLPLQGQFWEAYQGERAQAAAALQRYLARQRRPNRFGYLPVAQEWDVWCATLAADELFEVVSEREDSCPSKSVCYAVHRSACCCSCCCLPQGEPLCTRRHPHRHHQPRQRGGPGHAGDCQRHALHPRLRPLGRPVAHRKGGVCMCVCVGGGGGGGGCCDACMHFVVAISSVV